MTAKAIARLERGLEDELGVPVALERPSNPEHGDYATNAAMRAAPMKRKLPMEIAEELRVVASGLPGVKDAAVAPPGFVNLQLDPAWYGEALGGDPRGGRGLRCGLRRRAREGAGGVRLGEPHGAADGRLSAERAPTEIPSPACSTSPATRSSASSTSTTGARRSTSSTRRSTRGAGGRSRRPTATRGITSASSPSSTPTR